MDQVTKCMCPNCVPKTECHYSSYHCQVVKAINQFLGDDEWLSRYYCDGVRTGKILGAAAVRAQVRALLDQPREDEK